ncbi:MAG: DUF4375 domain-containing protein [Planctomycetota bacterium]
MKYSVHSTVLKTPDDAELAWAVIEAIYDDLPMGSARKLRAFMDGLTTGQQSLIAIDCCTKEVRNGGFAQLFENPWGDLLPWAIEGLGCIGLPRLAKVFKEAVERLGAKDPGNTKDRRKALMRIGDEDEQEEHWFDLNSEFLARIGDRGEGLARCMGDYVRAFPEEFLEQ